MRQPEEITGADYEQIVERVAAVDVAKEFGKVCLRLPHEAATGRRVSKVWDVSATTNAIVALGNHLIDQRVSKVTIESTSDYWRIWFYLLEAAGLDVQLVNARDVKNVPGRPKTDKPGRPKTDKIDALWLAKLTEKGLLRPSFVPPAEIRRLRDYTRLRTDLTRDRTRHWLRLEKLLEDSLIKVSSVASKLTTLSVRDMLEALIAGERDPHRLANLARGRMRTKQSALVEALTGRFDDHHAELARMLLDQIDTLTHQIAILTDRIEALIAAIPAAATPDAGTNPRDGDQDQDTSTTPTPTRLSAVARRVEIPGLSPRSVQQILAEIGLDMTRFPTADHLVSWTRLCPAPFSPGRRLRPARPAKAIHTSRASSERPRQPLA